MADMERAGSAERGLEDRFWPCCRRQSLFRHTSTAWESEGLALRPNRAIACRAGADDQIVGLAYLGGLSLIPRQFRLEHERRDAVFGPGYVHTTESKRRTGPGILDGA